MPVWRLQTTFARDTLLPADGLTITPHFNTGSVIQDPQGLCDDLAAALDAWDNASGQITVKAYDAQGVPPVYPQGDAVVNVGAAPASTGVRETAVCLSFFAGTNRPRNRGRLFIPTVIMPGTQSSPRPSPTIQQKVADLVPILTGLGGVDVDWSVYSRMDNVPRSVSHWWIDDAWDTIRSRGLRPSARLEGSTSEA